MKIRLQLTEACNYNCVFCYKEGAFDRRIKKLDCGDYEFLLEVARSAGFDEVKLVGGEPTLSPDLIPVTKRASELGYREIRITTNGRKLGGCLHVGG